MRYRQYLTATIIALFFTSLSTHIQAEQAWEAFFDSTFGDFSEELEIAKSENKKSVLIFFEKQMCPFCARMKRTVLNKPHIQNYFRKHFMIYPIDIEGDVEITAFNGKQMKLSDFSYKNYNVYASPTFIFFDLDGKEIARYTGVTRNADEFMWLGEYVVEGAYKTMTFRQYRKNRRTETAQREASQ